MCEQPFSYTPKTCVWLLNSKNLTGLSVLIPLFPPVPVNRAVFLCFTSALPAHTQTSVTLSLFTADTEGEERGIKGKPIGLHM